MFKFLSLILISTLVISTNSFAQSASQGAENLFTEKTKEATEEIVEGIKDTISESDNAIEKTVNELEKKINNEAEAVATEKEVKAEDSKTKKGISDDPMENTLILSLKTGPVIIKLEPEIAPHHVARIKELTREGFYDGVVFHRVIDGFMAQTGDPTGTGRGGSGKNIDAEFNDKKHVKGVVSMARAADPNSADSQFFIVLDDAPHLDGNYTAFGEVISGMELVEDIKKGYGPNGMVNEPDAIITMKVAADLEEENLPELLKKASKEVTGGKNKVENKEKPANDNAAKTEEEPSKETN